MKKTTASRAIMVWLESGSDDAPRTQELLAQRLGEVVGRPVSQSTVSHIARGLQQPRADLIAAFRIVLGIDVEEWLADETDAA